MAGDWIKVRCDLDEDPAVAKMAAALGLDRFAVIGRLVKLWTWADRQSRDGNADVTLLYVDELTNTRGMGDAMVLAGWLEVPENGRIRFPRFDRHNGKSAKNRALGQRRQQTFRSNAHVTNKSRSRNADRVTREEKSLYIQAVDITKESERSQPVAEPHVETPRSTPSHETPSIAKANRQLAEQRAAADHAELPPGFASPSEIWKAATAKRST